MPLLQIADMSTLSKLVNRLPRLKEFIVVGNPCFPVDDTLHRVQLLAHVPRAIMPLFPLLLNDTLVSIEERVAAARLGMKDSTAAAADSQCSRLRMTFTLAEMSVTGNETLMDLSRRNLTSVIDLVCPSCCWLMGQPCLERAQQPSDNNKIAHSLNACLVEVVTSVTCSCRRRCRSGSHPFASCC